MKQIKFKMQRFHHQMLRPRLKVKKMYWEFHKGDADFNPTVPHGHSLDGKYKLELWSGKIYEVSTGKLCAMAKGKEMKTLYDLRGFVSFVEECRSEYERTHPDFIIPQLTVNSQFTADKRYTLCKKRNSRKQYLIVLECEDKA